MKGALKKSRYLTTTLVITTQQLKEQLSVRRADVIAIALLALDSADWNNRIKQRRAWLLLGWVTAERSCPCNQPACPAIGGGLEVTFKPLVTSLSAREGVLALTSPGKIRLLYFTLLF
ncbi:hypothetical protein J6590_051169 [Homalodisca vitripennis]|nr:hypothetical protein J6590_051169 [Homalodisca vitripennis]